MIGIYVIINNINNKKYIGQSVNIERRLKEHKRRAFNPNSNLYNCPLYTAIKKYKIENFSFLVLEECQKKDLNKREKYWINYYETNNSSFGYNLTKGGDSSKPLILNDVEVKEIKHLLRTTNITQEEIANKFSITQRTVSYINNGTFWVDENESYPIRVFTSRAKKFNCKYCGKEVWRNNDTCFECANFYSRKVPHPSREVLKEEIRKFSFTYLGDKYGVSDNAVRQWCKRYGLPYKTLMIRNMSDEDWENI